jgi:formylglycine-generating enzyme required for sulfatase activity
MTDAGAYTLSASPYGTFDQGGNVWEWNEGNEALISSEFRGLRGGSWGDGSSVGLHASLRNGDDSSLENIRIGFRVASIPEPSTTCLAALASLGVSLWRRQRSMAPWAVRIN